MVFINSYIFISLLAVFGFFCAFLLFLNDYEENKCEMTYMFQYPQFVRISMKADNELKKYGLYSYSEGHVTEKARKMQFNGIPVLFIPGNAGSYKQVRSLASVALRKALNSQPGFHFDYFTIDFNEELSGLNGALLYDQVMYTKQSLYRILELYANNQNKPTSVILIGHSMGGIIAEGLLAALTPNNNLISLVITLASPHKRPPLYFDVYLYNFYKDIEVWDNKMNSTFITIFGGFNDFLVTPHLTFGKHFNTVTTHIPKTWLPMDHLCILWCKQLVLVLNRALFDSVDLKTKQISQDKEYVVSVFKHYLLHNSGVKTNLGKSNNSLIPIDDRGNWIEYLPRQYSVELIDGSRQPQWYMVRLVKQPLHEILSIVGLNIQTANWIYVCSAYTIKEQSRVCVDAMDLSHLSQIVPSIMHKRRFLNINLHELSDNFTHVVVKIPPTSEPVTLHVDVHGRERELVVNLPVWSLKHKVIIEETSENSLYYELYFPDLSHAIQSYQLFVEPKKCRVQKHHATATLSVPWSNLDYHAIFTETQNTPMNLRLYSSKPSHMTNFSAFVKLILDPNCRYSVSVKLAIPNIFAQFARLYSPFIFANVVAVTLLSFKSQLHNIESKGRCSLFFTALMTDCKPYYVIPVAKVLAVIMSSSALLKTLPAPDIQTLNEEGIGFASTMILYILSTGVVWILTMTLSISIFCFESTIHNIVLKIISKSVIGTTTTYDWLLKGLKKFPVFVSILLLTLCMSTCGGLALCLGLIFYFLKLTQMAQDVVENMIMKLVTIVVRKFKLRPQIQQKIQYLLLRKSQVETTTNGRIVDDAGQDATHSRNGVDHKSNIDSASTSQNTTNAVDRNEESLTDETNDIAANKNSSDTFVNNSKDELPRERSNIEDDTGLFSIFTEITENNELYFHFTIFCLWFLVTCINIPVVLTWAHNFKYSSKIDNDPSFIPGLIVCTCALALWQFEFPKIDKKWYRQLGYIIYILAVYSFAYGTFSVYRLNYVLSSIIALVTLHQLLAPKKMNVSVDDSLYDNYNKVKAKLE